MNKDFQEYCYNNFNFILKTFYNGILTFTLYNEEIIITNRNDILQNPKIYEISMEMYYKICIENKHNILNNENFKE